MRIIPAYQDSEGGRAGFWRRVSEGALTLFIMAIFCLSAAQIAILVYQQMQQTEDSYSAEETARSSRMRISHSGIDLEMAMLGYYLGDAQIGIDQIKRQDSYFVTMFEAAQKDAQESTEIKKSAEGVIRSLDNLRAYYDQRPPLRGEKAGQFLDDISRFRTDVRGLVMSMREKSDSAGMIQEKKNHTFLMSSIGSMAVSGLGLIVLLLVKLRVSESLLADRRNLSSLLEPRIAAIETAMDGVAITDSRGRLRYVNQALTSYHGYAEPEMLTDLHWKILYDEEQQKWFDEEVIPFLKHEGRWRGHCKGLRLNGTYFHQDVAIAALDDGGLVFVVRDYTDLLESIVLSNRRLAAIEAAGDGIGIVDKTGRLTYINHALRDLHGLTDEEIDDYVGQDWTLLYSHKGKLDINEKVLPALSRTGHWQGEAPIIRKNGSVIQAELSLTMLPDGGFIGTARDISERKRAEQEKEELQKQFYQAQKMEAIGRMAGGIAHDFNNILSSILGYAEFLIEDLDKNSPQANFARQIYNGGTQARRLVDQILAFSRRREGGMSVLSLADAVRDTADMLVPVMPPSIKLKVENDGGDNIVRANPTQISQALMNLCVNAIDAMEDRMDAAITVTSQSIVAGDENVPAAMLAADLPKADAEPIVTIVSGKDGECSMLSGVLQRGMTYACVSVGDNGCGMSREVMEHIFEPFFTTKPVDRGTGLGLAAVHGIVAGHRGAMTVRSRKDEGTVFTLYFPQTAEEPEQKQGHTAKVVMGTGHVLVVDDQPDVATIACEMLARLGYMADSVSSADEAIDRLREKPDEYDMVLSDYSMPGMSGVDLASAIRADFPHMPVIIMTGYGRRKLEKEIKDNPSVVTMIRKPLDRVALSQVISKTLKRADSAAG